jgi:hypothetical protein
MAMKLIICGLMLAMMLVAVPDLGAEVVIDFEELTLDANSVVAASPDRSTFESQGVRFSGSWNTEFNCCADGWAYSNQKDLETKGFTNGNSAYALPDGGGVLASDNFGVLYLTTPDATQISLPTPTQVKGMYVANTTYVYHAMATGDDGNEPPFVKGPFSVGDFFKLDIHGLDADGQRIGTVDFLLADFADQNTGIVAEWTWVDLTPLGDHVSALQFDLSSTDNDDVFGMNTPSYFAMDNLTIASVPEPQFAPSVLLVMIIIMRRSKVRS